MLLMSNIDACMDECKEKIKSGYRLPCPTPLQDDIYNGLSFYHSIIRMCWEEPTGRPDFKDLVKMIETFMQEEMDFQEENDFSYQEPEDVPPQVSLSKNNNSTYVDKEMGNLGDSSYVEVGTHFFPRTDVETGPHNSVETHTLSPGYITCHSLGFI